MMDIEEQVQKIVKRMAVVARAANEPSRSKSKQTSFINEPSTSHLRLGSRAELIIHGNFYLLLPKA